MHLAVVLDCRDPAGLARFWSEAIGYERVHEDDTYVALRSRDGSRPTLLLQRVPEPKHGKNRMHLDVHTEHFEADLARLEALGAERVATERVESGARWVVLADPEGNEFCLVTREA